LNDPNRNNGTTHNSKTWTIVTYCRPLVRKISDLFKQTKVNIDFRSMNTKYYLIKPKTHKTIDT